MRNAKDSMAGHVDVVLHAKQFPGGGSGSWKVDVFVGSRDRRDRVASDVELRDPLAKQQQRDVKWYVEQYAQVSPYSVTQAGTARTTLDHYAVSILDQLKLRELVANQARTEKLKETSVSVSVSVSVEIIEEVTENTSANTVHRLHWELLEDPAAWRWDQGSPDDHGRESTVSNPIIIKRSTRPIQEPVNELNRVPTWPCTHSQNSDSSNTVNVLLVVARNLKRNAAVYNDISPSMAFSILTRMQHDLQARRSHVQLNIEIVRPGTFAAFAHHLARSELAHGPGYFHIVHFDMHGVVSSKKKTASLYFSSPSSDGTVDVPAQDVASLLQRFQVPFAILNACESARADCGDDANIAKLFKLHGVKEVLAMSFKVSNSAAELFLRAFFSELLLRQASFSEAASRARNVLRASPTRNARFGLHLSILDWFVPVLYSSGGDSALQISDMRNQDQSRKSENNSIEPFEHEESSKPYLTGRDFDILRLEKILLAEHVLYLHGPAGVGKSALLNHCYPIWAETSFVDAVVYVDFTEGHTQTIDDLVNATLQQLLVCTNSVDQANYWTMGSKKSYNDEANLEKIVDILSFHRTMLIFDGLHASHSTFAAQFGRQCGSSMSEINLFLRKLIPFTSPLTEHPSFLILAGRREDSEWLSEQLDHPFADSVNSYHLRGLEMADSIELSLSVLRKIGEDTNSWKRSDIDQLEHVVETLQGIPDCLIKLLPLVRNEIFPWPSFHDSLLLGLPDLDRLSLQNSSPILWDELDTANLTLPDDIFATLMILGLYWHEGPLVDEFAEIIISNGIAPHKKSVQSALLLAKDRGIITSHKGSSVAWIHPEFSLYARIWAHCDYRESQKAQVSTPSLLDSLVQGMNRLTVSRKQKATEMINILLDPSPEVLAKCPDGKTFISGLLGEAEMQFRVRMGVDLLRGLDYKEMPVKYRKAFRNLVCYIHICVTSGESLPLKEWPVDLLAGSASNIRVVPCTAGEALFFAERYEELLKHFLKRVGGLAVPPEYQRFALAIANYLAATHNSEVSLPTNRTNEFLQLALGIIAASESKYGPIEDSVTMYQKGFVFRYKMVVALKEADVADAKKYWQMSSNNDDEYLLALEKEQSQPENVQDDSSIIGQLKAKSQNHSIPKAFIQSRKQAFSHIIHAATEQIEHGNQYEISEPLMDAFDQGSFGLKYTHDALEESGFKGLESDTRWWPQKFDMVRLLQRYQQPLHRLEQIESAKDAGDSLRATEHHLALVTSAMEKGDFDEVVEHMDAIEDIYATDPIFNSALQEWRSRTEILRSTQKLYHSSLALEHGSSDAVEPLLNAMDNQMAALKAQNADPDAIQILDISRDLLKREADRDKSGLLADSKEFGDRTKNEWRKLFQLVMKNSRDPTFIKRFFTNGLEIQQLYLKIYDAETSGDYETALTLIDQLEDLSSTEVGNILLHSDEMKTHRENDTAKLRWNKAIIAWKESIVAGEYDAARAQLEILSDDGSLSPNNKKNLPNLYQTTERFHLDSKMRDAKANLADNPASAVVIYDKILEMHERCEFSHLGPDELPGTIEHIRLNRYLAQSMYYDEAHKWDEAIAALDNWLALKGLVGPEDPRGHDNIHDLRENCEFQKHNEAVIELDRDCLFAEAQEHLAALTALFERQQASPEIRRRICPRMTREMLNSMGDQLRMKRTLIDYLGFESGKAVILQARAATGYTHPNVIRSDWS